MLYTINYIRLWLKGKKKCTEPFCSIRVGRKVYYAEYILPVYSKRSPMGEGLLYSKSPGGRGLIYYGGRFTLWHRVLQFNMIHHNIHLHVGTSEWCWKKNCVNHILCTYFNLNRNYSAILATLQNIYYMAEWIRLILTLQVIKIRSTTPEIP